ncbi:spermidine/putrescine ABC transporter substrate-binding protein [Kribbella antibiotica]|uniref:Spermidine/putrescine ABC transporter substrate-binding protein n=1 Tax=Kribbella antibiotica TaxID=190195 RepID=A0A4R4ZY72_9ACTN|nr:spermidine/putrescine ABC transporter substrate-binding protein [Kribbella antibiotica]TDD63296.1 spermidine/putrescine ABC transporter substrate-binding protein [Kribbella antibiotica]
MITRRLAVLLAAALAMGGCTSPDNQAEPPAPGSYPTAVAKGSTLTIYSWADYISDENLEAFEKATGVHVKVDAYASAEEAVAKLRLTQGTSGYDLVVMDGSYIPQLVQSKALLAWDKSRLPGLSGLSKTFTGKSWDPTNTYAIPKSGGSTGYVWDSAVVKTPPTDWNSFYASFADPAVKRRTSVIDGAPSFVGSYFWGNGISDQTTERADYVTAEQFYTANVLPHLKEFNSYPRADLASGDIVLAQAFTGDARGALMDGAKSLRFALGGPKTDLYVDHWVLPKGSQNIAAAHAFVQFLLNPENAARETKAHGYYTGVEASKQYLKDLPYKEIVFFDDGVPPDRFVPAEVTPARKQAVATFQRLKAVVSR